MKKKKLIIIGAVVIVAGAGTFFAMSNKKEIPPTTVTVENAEIRRLIATVSATGRVEPVTQVKISAEIPGRIVKLPIKEGDNVEEGQFLCELDAEVYKSALDGARSALRSARASKEKADADLKRIQELVQRGMASQSDLDGAIATAELSAAELDRAVAQEKQSVENLSKTRINSPMTGTISMLNKKVGELTLGSQFQEDIILVVADLSKMQVSSAVDEHDIVGVKLGDSTRVEIDAFPDTSFVGLVTEISQSSSNTESMEMSSMSGEVAATNFDVKVTIVDTIRGLRPGMSANVDVATDYRNQALSVSIQSIAIRDKEEGSAVEVKSKEESKSSREIQEQVKSGTVDTTKMLTRDRLETGVFVFKEGKAVWTPVKTGIASERHMEVLSGIAEGDSVINGPYRVLARDLKNDDKVELEKKEEKGKDGDEEKKG